MIYREFGKTGVKVSVIGLGGHEFHNDGKIKGFGDNHSLAVSPGYIFPGFGMENRETLVKKALELGINFFDLTIDSEKEAMGRVLRKLKPSQEIYLQTRPEGMVYTYDPQNRKMGDYTLLRGEVIRILNLLGRECVDILNFAFMKEALQADEEYMDKIGDNIRRLKQEGLIRFANADTFSGEETYLKQVASGYFDSVFINYNLVDSYMNDRLIPEASQKGMGVLCRELFRKGNLFKMAEEAGLTDRGEVARLCIKWILSNPSVNSVVLGVSAADQLESNVSTLENISMTEGDWKTVENIMNSGLYKEEHKQRGDRFLQG